MKRFRGVSGPLRKLWDGPDVQSRNKMLIKPVTTYRSLFLQKKTFPLKLERRRANLSASQVFARLAVVIFKEATEEWRARGDDLEPARLLSRQVAHVGLHGMGKASSCALKENSDGKS